VQECLPPCLPPCLPVGGLGFWGNHGGIAPTRCATGFWGNHGGIAPTRCATGFWGNHGGIAPTRCATGFWGNHGGIAPIVHPFIVQRRKFPSSFFLLPSSFFLLPSSFFLLPSSFFLLPSSFFLLPSSFFLYFSTLKNQDLIISIIQSKVAITCFNPASSCKRDNGKFGERLSVGSVGKDKPIELNLLRSSNHFGASLKGD
jgi:hypothetical protein